MGREAIGLDDDELRELSVLARGGDVEARNRIVEANLGLVEYAVRPFLGRKERDVRMDNGDILQEGRMGLIEAAVSFDEGRGFAFSTFAKRVIWRVVAEAVARSGHLVPSERSRADAARWRKLEARGLGELEIARELALCDLGVERVKAALAACSENFNGAVEGWDEDLACRPDADPAEAEDWLHDGLSRLDPRDREALVLLYGIGGREPVRGDALARRLGVTRAGASHVVKKARERLAAALAG